LFVINDYKCNSGGKMDKKDYKKPRFSIHGDLLNITKGTDVGNEIDEGGDWEPS
jgi:hypothetical protein